MRTTPPRPRRTWPVNLPLETRRLVDELRESYGSLRPDITTIVRVAIERYHAEQVKEKQTNGKN